MQGSGVGVQPRPAGMREGGLSDCGPTRRAGRDAYCGYKFKSVYEEPLAIQNDEIYVYGMVGTNTITDIAYSTSWNSQTPAFDTGHYDGKL